MVIMADVDQQQFSSTMFAALQYFAHSGDPAYLLLPQRCLLAAPNEYGDSSLHVAINSGQVQAACTIARVLDKKNLDNYNKEMETPLHVAVRLNQVETVKTLVGLGANVLATDIKGNTAVHMASRAEDPCLLNEIISAAPSDFDGAQLSAEGLAPVHVAAVNANHNVCALLIKHCRNSINVQDAVNGRTALHLAVRKGYMDHVAILIDQGADVNAHDFQGNTPLHIVATTNQVKIAALLLQNHADLSALNLYGQTPVELAHGHGSDVLEQALNESYIAAKNDASMSAIEDGFEVLSVEDVASLPSSDWEIGSSNRASFHARRKINRILKGHKKSMRVPFLASKSRKEDAANTSTAASASGENLAVSAKPSQFNGKECRVSQQKTTAQAGSRAAYCGTNAAQEKERLAREYTVTDYVVAESEVRGTSHYNQPAKAAEAARAGLRHTRVVDRNSLAMID